MVRGLIRNAERSQDFVTDISPAERVEASICFEMLNGHLS